MVVIHPFPGTKPVLDAPVVAYVNESSPVRGQASLRAQIRAVQKRAKRDGTAIKLLVIESGGRTDHAGCGLRLCAVIEAAALDPTPRLLYVADHRVVADGPEAKLATLAAIADANFELRAPWGTISRRGRTVKRLERAAAAIRTPVVARAVRSPPAHRVAPIIPWRHFGHSSAGWTS